MCGICGQLNFDPTRPVDPALIEAMCLTMTHRGPDDQGIFVTGRGDHSALSPCGLGHRRLSIVDLEAGQQPIGNEDETQWVVGNGEVYNYPELRPELEGKGHRFRTRSDTEVIVHAYEEFGDDFLRRLNGMFALALWDGRRRRLLLARDRVGIKPLYYFVGGDRLVFGSEIKAILKGEVPRRVDLQALHDYLSFNYIPAPATIFRGIRKLPPGHLLCWERGKVELRSYWDIPLPEGESPPREESYYSEALHELLRRSVKRHLMSDVPLGVFLSGGVDSSTLVAIMSEVGVSPIRTFSIGFEEESFNELPYAREVARRFGAEHHEMVVRPEPRDMLPLLAHFFDEPFADSSAIPVYYLSRMARENVKVALGGDGGDELFAGYETYSAYKLARLYRKLPSFITAFLLPSLVKTLPVSHRRVSVDYRAKRFVKGALSPPEEGHYMWKVIFDEDAKEALYKEESLRHSEDSYRHFKGLLDRRWDADKLRQLQYIDFKVYLADDILVKVDRMSMAHSLEVRVPLLDHEVVEFVFNVPSNLNHRGWRSKYLLKRMMRGCLPYRVLHSRKRGFNVPMAGWLRGELFPAVRDLLSPERLRRQGYFDPEAVMRLVESHQEKRADFSRNIWGLLVFMLWWEKWKPS